MRIYDREQANATAYITEDAALLAYPPFEPSEMALAFVKANDPYTPQKKPCRCYPDWRRLAWEDFCIRRAVLILTMAYDGKDGRETVTQGKAIKLLQELRPAPAKAGKKPRDDDTVYDVWRKKRNKAIWGTHTFWGTRAILLSVEVAITREYDRRLEARRAAAYAAIGG